MSSKRRPRSVSRIHAAYEPAYIARMISERRALFRAAVGMLGYSMREAALQLNVSYNHLTLVLDAEREPSERLEAGITDMIRRAKPLLTAALRKY